MPSAMAPSLELAPLPPDPPLEPLPPELPLPPLLPELPLVPVPVPELLTELPPLDEDELDDAPPSDDAPPFELEQPAPPASDKRTHGIADFFFKKHLAIADGCMS